MFSRQKNKKIRLYKTLILLNQSNMSTILDLPEIALGYIWLCLACDHTAAQALRCTCRSANERLSPFISAVQISESSTSVFQERYPSLASHFPTTLIISPRCPMRDEVWGADATRKVLVRLNAIRIKGIGGFDRLGLYHSMAKCMPLVMERVTCIEVDIMGIPLFKRGSDCPPLRELVLHISTARAPSTSDLTNLDWVGTALQTLEIVVNKFDDSYGQLVRRLLSLCSNTLRCLIVRLNKSSENHLDFVDDDNLGILKAASQCLHLETLVLPLTLGNNLSLLRLPASLRRFVVRGVHVVGMAGVRRMGDMIPPMCKTFIVNDNACPQFRTIQFQWNDSTEALGTLAIVARIVPPEINVCIVVKHHMDMAIATAAVESHLIKFHEMRVHLRIETLVLQHRHEIQPVSMFQSRINH